MFLGPPESCPKRHLDPFVHFFHSSRGRDLFNLLYNWPEDVACLKNYSFLWGILVPIYHMVWGQNRVRTAKRQLDAAGNVASGVMHALVPVVLCGREGNRGSACACSV